MKADELEETVRKSLEKKLAASAESVPAVLAAVSGGADSMVMLTVLKNLSASLEFGLHAVTVNHNIRPEQETAGDAELVREYCAKLDVPCIVSVLARNEVAETAFERGCGTEEAARFLRYQAFERAADSCSASLVCIAHNRNDRLETILGRFFQGARAESASGMQKSRDMYFRPLFDVSRQDIEEYAACRNVPFRTDATNYDNRYFRNRIRNELIPVLETLIPGWDTAILHGAEKNALTAAALGKHAACAVWEPDCKSDSDCHDKTSVCLVSTDSTVFDALETAERIEALYRGLYQLDTEQRVPYGMLRAFAEGRPDQNYAACRDKTWKVEGAGISLVRKDSRIIIRKTEKAEIDGFYCPVYECGCYAMPWGEIFIRESKVPVCENAFYAENIKNGAISGMFPLPVIIRSRQQSDRIRDKDGGHKEVSKLFSEWHVPERYEAEFPVFDNGEVLGIWGGVFDYPDYFVKPLEDHR